MKRVTSEEALRDLNRFLRDMYTWDCVSDAFADQNKESEVVGVTRHTVKAMRRVVDATLESLRGGTPIRVADGYDSVYAQLVGQLGRRER